MKDVKRIFIFGSTGSIGETSLNVINMHKDHFEVFGLSAYSQIERLAEQAIKFNVKVVIVPNQQAKKRFLASLPKNYSPPEILVGDKSLVDIASSTSYDIAIAAIVGIAGLPSALEAAKHGKRILLANKEVLVVAGELFMKTAMINNSEIIPIDSEHNAIFQCLRNNMNDSNINLLNIDNVSKIIITASGGPFRDYNIDQLENVTPEQAYTHPNWQMGRKISVDSATMMNKGLEVIEACWLFSTNINILDILIHPQSIIHSMVEYVDGSIIANLSKTNMAIPISYALGFPTRLKNSAGFLDLVKIASLDFFKPDLEKFRCLYLAFEALRLGQGYCIALNASNEVAVDAFLSGRLKYTWIPRVIEATFEWYSKKNHSSISSLDEIITLDLDARHFASNIVVS